MAFYNLPLLWVLGGRNDVFMWITGWSFRESQSYGITQRYLLAI